MRIPATIMALVLAPLVGCDESTLTSSSGRAPAAGPLRVHAGNRRYLDDGSGCAILLVGSHTWSNLQDEGPKDPPDPFVFENYLRMLESHNHNFMRLWRLEPAAYRYQANGAMNRVQPHPWPRTGPGRTADDKPRFDLARFDDAYFARLRQRVQAAGEKGIYVGIMLFEGHALSQATDAWFAHPANGRNNINGIDADADADGRGIEWHSLSTPAVLAVQEAYVRKVIETVNDLDNVLYEICNESHPDSDAWQRHMIDFIQSVERGMPSQHLVIYSAPLGQHGEYMWNSNAELVAPGKKWEGERIPLREDPPENDGRKVVMLDTDHLWGCGGEAQWVFKAFMRGYHPIYMDPWKPGGDCGRPDAGIRWNLGAVLRFADAIDLAPLTPRNELASSTYCLANPGREYLVYVPDGGSVEVDVSDASASDLFAVEWFDPRRGRSHRDESVSGGARRSLAAPFSGDAFVHVRLAP